MKDPYTVVKKVQTTEKGTALGEKCNKYFFMVAPDANKMDIKRAVEKLFRVDVVGVNTMNCEGKKKRMRSQRYGKKADWKRAIVTLKAGAKIETI